MVELGVERLLTSRIDRLTGDRIGLITNPSGVDSELRSTVDLLAENEHVDLCRLFGPEHGVRGRASAGEHVESGVDGPTGLPVSSLYGETRRPTGEMLADIDTLVYDMQDLGVRYYTLAYTLAHAIEGAAEHDTRVVVLDRFAFEVGLPGEVHDVDQHVRLVEVREELIAEAPALVRAGD